MALSKCVSIDEMRDMVKNKSLTYREISKQLQIKYHQTTGFSERSVRRFCLSNGIQRRDQYDKAEIKKLIFLEASKVCTHLFYTVYSLFNFFKNIARSRTH